MIASNRKPLPSPKELIFAPGIIINDLTEGLVKKGHDVTLFAPEGTKTSARLITSGTKSLYEDFASEKDFKQKRSENLESYFMQDAQYQLLLDSIAFEYIQKNNFDIVHSHNPRHELYFTPLINVPAVFTFHDTEREVSSEIDKQRLEKFSKSCYFVSISNAQREVFGNLNWAGTVYNGVDTNNYSFSDGGESLLFAGRMDRRKGIDIAVEIAHKLNKPLLIAGDIVKNLDGEKIYREIKPLIDGEKIKYLGHIRYDKMSPIYQQSFALLLPIRWVESFGLVMTEAMACGTPVIAFNKGAVSEVVRDRVTGFVCPSDSINCMTEKINELYQMSKNDYHKIRKNCRKHVTDNFSNEKMVEGYEKIYEKVITDWRNKNA
ncbi:MAG: hypothetical protein HW405_116 [Candidatus Berkelbacteria bacterium]|nr:hypothetical protein [Candidatus Berkelbacteria bacterium]